MSDYRRVYIPGGCFFFTVVTWQRRCILDTPERVELLRRAFRKIIDTRPFTIDAAVVLPDHLHCIWRLPPDDSDYSGRWREIKKQFSGAPGAESNQRRERQVWQRRFWEHAIRDEEDWRRHLDYVHYNPVKHGLTHRAGGWPCSSFRHAVERGWYPADWGVTEPNSVSGLDLEWDE